MGEVVSFDAYKEGKEILLLTEPCPRPFHKEKYVKELWCRRCGVVVELSSHPSFEDGPRWYG